MMANSRPALEQKTKQIRRNLSEDYDLGRIWDFLSRLSAPLNAPLFEQTATTFLAKLKMRSAKRKCPLSFVNGRAGYPRSVKSLKRP